MITFALHSKFKCKQNTCLSVKNGYVLLIFYKMCLNIGRARAGSGWPGPRGPGPGPAKLAKGWPGPARGQSTQVSQMCQRCQ